MYLREILTKFLGVYANYTWLVQTGIILCVTLLVNYLQRKIVKRLADRLKKTHQVWDDTLLQALSAPLTVFVWFSSLTVVCHYMFLDFSLSYLIVYLEKTRFAGFVILVVWFLWRYVGKIEHRLVCPVCSHKAPADATSVSVVGRLAKLCLFVLTVLIVLQFWGIPLTGILAFGGAGALAVGIAAQDLIANFFGGLMIFLDKPFKIGDWIESPDRNIQGTVQEIGWRLTKVITFDKRPLYIPNAVFTKIVIINPQRMTNRRIKATVGVRYDDANQVKIITEDIKNMLQLHEGIDQHQSLMVNFIGFGPSSLDIEVYCFTKTTVWATWRDVQQDVFIKILEIVDNHGAAVAFPTRTLEMPKGMELIRS